MTRLGAFDPLAESYDRRFAMTRLGQRLRARIWTSAEEHFAADQRVLDIGCGSGVDTLHLARRGCRVLALDPSLGMCRRTREKAKSAGLSDRVSVAVGALGMWADGKRSDGMQSGGMPAPSQCFDGAVSNFGVLNCVDDLTLAAAQLGRALRPGAMLVASVMPPHCAWEVAWYLRKRDPRTALRRLSPGGSRVTIGSRSLRVRYPSPRTLRLAFAPWFRQRSLEPLGLFLPPTYAIPWLEADPRRLDLLDRWERRARGYARLAGFADHYLIVLERLES